MFPLISSLVTKLLILQQTELLSFSPFLRHTLSPPFQLEYNGKHSNHSLAQFTQIVLIKKDFDGQLATNV